MLSVDERARELQLECVVDEELKSMNGDYLQILNAYTRGVNQCVESEGLPFEFWVLGVAFREWTAKDSLMIFKALSLELANTWKLSVLRTQLKHKLGPQLAELLIPGNGPHYKQDYSNITVPAKTELSSAFRKGGEQVAPFLGNSWVIHGNYTVSHKPILAIDLSRVKQIPGEFYLASLKFPNKLIGATIPGIPLFFLGSNGKISWGITGSPSANIQVLEAPKERLLTSKNELNEIKEKDKVVHAVGNLIVRCEEEYLNKAVVLVWAGFKKGDTSFEAFFDLCKARNKIEFMIAIKKFRGFSVTFTFATVMLEE
eukprot:TRINITY_DN6246_c0_g2_i1.p1 TRINITY_DN6246_c0_g2~~TRINITY_DN6246_c0_g2_i1.p1  ORF type:complete len:314 (+),score=51.08 TRINITY_DN6246_c0_g2_i1:401-1342(+)